MSTDYSKFTREELERIAAAAEAQDPLMNLNNLPRSFEPTASDVILYLENEGSYRIPHGPKEKFSMSMHSDRLAELKTFATSYDMTVSSAADLLFRIALGDIDEWFYNHSVSNDKNDKEAKTS